MSINVSRLAMNVLHDTAYDMLSSQAQRHLSELLRRGEAYARKGLGVELQQTVQRMPNLTATTVTLGTPTIAATGPAQSPEAISDLRDALMQLAPWRKGPFSLFGVQVDAEWRSDWKWARLRPFLPELHHKRILDIGCGNGYYLFRIAHEAPAIAIGVDPFLRYYYQYLALQRYLQTPGILFIPCALDDVLDLGPTFDVVFCMGMLNHHRSPLDCLRQLAMLLDSRGTAVVEALTISGAGDHALSPYPRYAKMHNCYFLPTVPCLIHWLRRAGFDDVQVVGQTATTCEEQRRTEWMTFESLADFLDPRDPALTVEGYPAPIRTTVVCRAKHPAPATSPST